VRDDEVAVETGGDEAVVGLPASDDGIEVGRAVGD
jgi:hypothetical protein